MGYADFQGKGGPCRQRQGKASGPESGVCLVAKEQPENQRSWREVRQRKNVRDKIRGNWGPGNLVR